MQNIVKHLLVVAGVVACIAVAGGHASAAAQGGLTLTPGTLTLTLAPKSTQQTAEFTIANQYSGPVTLHFAFEPRTDEDQNKSSTSGLQIAHTDVTIAPGTSVTQLVTLRDSKALAPGSHLADLVITQFGTPGGSVGVLPSMRMPLVLVKQDGAVSAIAFAGLGGPRVNLGMPGSLTVTIKNTGNMIAIPRGTITVTSADGRVVRQGALNTSSLAVTPGNRLALATPLNTLGNAYWPGIYRTTISYGLGGGQATATASSWFFYIAWWHILVIGSLGVLVYYGKRLLARMQRKKPPAHKPSQPAKRPILIGRNA